MANEGVSGAIQAAVCLVASGMLAWICYFVGWNDGRRDGRKASEEIQREIREGTPNTPERIAFMREADAIYAKHRPAQRGSA